MPFYLPVACSAPAPPAATAQYAGAPSPYPRIDLAIGYRVDPSWPAAAPGMAWGRTPGLFADRRDHVWAFTTASPHVREFAPDGKLVQAWGDEKRDRILSRHSVRLDADGNVWLAITKLHAVRKYSPDGRLLLSLGTEGEPGEDAAHLNQPTDVAFGPDGSLFVTDGYGNNRVVKYDRDGRFVKAWGKLGVAPGEFSVPHNAVCDARGRLYVADRNNVRIQVFDLDGNFVEEWRNLLVPWGLCLTASGELWACGSSPMRWEERPGKPMLGVMPKDQVFMKFDATGRVLQLWTVPLGTAKEERPGESVMCHGIAVDSKGNVYLGDGDSFRAPQKFAPLPAAENGR